MKGIGVNGGIGDLKDADVLIGYDFDKGQLDINGGGILIKW